MPSMSGLLTPLSSMALVASSISSDVKSSLGRKRCLIGMSLKLSSSSRGSSAVEPSGPLREFRLDGIVFFRLLPLLVAADVVPCEL